MTKIEFIENGPALIIGDNDGISYSVYDDDIKIAPRPVVAVCRCGKSKDGLFCDGSHKSNE